MAEKLNGVIRASGFPILAVILASCGGGGDGPGKCYSPTGAVCSAVGVPRSFPEVPPAIPSLAGLYKGISNNGQTVTSLVFSDDSFYAFYSGINNPTVAAGAVQGTIRREAVSSANGDEGKFTSTDAIDINLAGLGIQSVTASGTYKTKQVLNGTINYPALKLSGSFSANYSPDFELAPDISIIAGKYIVGSSVGNVSGTTTFEVDGSGNITGRDTDGCTFSGTAKPRTDGNAYSVTATYGASPCPLPGATANGIAFFDRTSNLIYAVGRVSGQYAGFVTIATKQ
jgi:hypothetical protein